MIVKRFLLTSFFVSALALSPLQAQQIDRAWMQSQGAAMADALKQEDREKLDDLLRQTLEASAGTDQEMFGLLTHVNVLIQLGEYRDIGPMAERILAREPSLLDGTWNESQTFLQQTAEATRQKGDIEGAISLLRARAAIFAAFQPQEKWMQHVVHNTSFAWAATAQNYSDAGDALERMYRSGPPFSDELKQQMLYMAETFLPLAQFSSSRGESVEAQLGLARLADYASLLGESPPLARAQAVRAVANALEVAGRLKDSEAHLQQALALTPANIDDASMLNERGLILEDIGRLALLRKDWEAAESAFSRADLILADAEKAGAEPSESSDRATRKILRGDVESGLGRHREALALYGEAVATMERRMQSSDMKWNEFPELVQAHIKQSAIYLDLDNKLTAIASARKALAVLRKHGREDDLTMPVNLSNIADAFSAAGELQDGLALMNEALELAKRILPDTSLLIADMATTRATVLERLGKAEQGRAAVAEAADIYRNPINRGRLKEGRLAFAMTAWNAVENGDDALAFEQMQWTQVTEAADAVEATAQRAAATDPVLADALRERQDLIAQIDRTQLQLRQATLTDGASSSDATGVLQANLEQRRDSLAALDRSLADRDYDILGVGGFSPLSLDAAQHLLREDEALVTFLLPGLKADLLGRDTASSNYVLVVKKTGIDVRPIEEASRRKLVARAGRIRCAMAIGCKNGDLTAVGEVASNTRGNLLASEPEAEANSLKNSMASITAEAHALYRDLLGPADDLIADAQHLVIAPPSDLLGLPFAALVTEPIGDSGKVNWLIRRQAISVLPSVGALASLRRDAPAATMRAPQLFAMGDPMIGGRRDSAATCDLQVAALRSAPTGDQQSLLSDARVDMATGFNLADPDTISALPALPDAECELRALEAAFATAPDAETQILLRRDAKEATVHDLSRAGTLAEFDTLIFATHGLVRGEAGATEPALVLTPPDKPSGLDDGLLTAGEVSSLRLDADLVVLSACNTAAGADTNADGMSGLARAFFHAGARALMVTHWSVYSSAATEMSSKMFATRVSQPNLRHAEALRLAMIDVMDDPRGGLRREPAYWAAFTIVGL